MTAAQLGLAVGLSVAESALWYPHVVEASQRFDFESPKRMAMWLAQCGEESISFRKLSENLNYSAAALRANWPTHFPTDQIADRYARQPEKIANRAYANRMGNGPEESGDGWLFRGRGLLQITGRNNARACGKALKADLESEPDLLLQPSLAALSAGWYWSVRGLNAFADRGDVAGATKVINGGERGLDERNRRYARAIDTLELGPPAVV